MGRTFNSKSSLNIHLFQFRSSQLSHPDLARERQCCKKCSCVRSCDCVLLEFLERIPSSSFVKGHIHSEICEGRRANDYVRIGLAGGSDMYNMAGQATALWSG